MKASILSTRVSWIFCVLLLAQVATSVKAGEGVRRITVSNVQAPNLNKQNIVNGPNVRSLCGAACQQCRGACPPFDELKNDNARCEAVLRVANSKYVSDAMDECKMTKCADVSYSEMCNFPFYKHRGTMSDSTIFVTNLGNPKRLESIDLQKAEYLRRAKEYDRMRGEVSKSLSSAERAYDQRVLEAVAALQKRFRSALELRSHVIAARKRHRSKGFRMEKLNSTQLRLERGKLRTRLNFWVDHHKLYKNALSSSAMNVMKARDEMVRQYDHIFQEVILLEILKGKHIAEDERANSLIILRKRARARIRKLRSITATVRAQRRFIDEVREETIEMLKSVTERLEQHRLHVPCGPLALSDVLTEALMSGE